MKNLTPKFKINRENNTAYIIVKTVLYNLNVIYAACYVFLERSYVLLDGDPKTEVIVKLKPKENNENLNLEQLGNEFMNELIRSGFYYQQNKDTMSIRTLILRRILMLEETPLYVSDKETEKKVDEMMDYIYGDYKKNQSTKNRHDTPPKKE